MSQQPNSLPASKEARLQLALQAIKRDASLTQGTVKLVFNHCSFREIGMKAIVGHILSNLLLFGLLLDMACLPFASLFLATAATWTRQHQMATRLCVQQQRWDSQTLLFCF